MIGRASIGNPWIFREIKHFIEHGFHHDAPSFLEKESFLGLLSEVSKKLIKMAIQVTG